MVNELTAMLVQFDVILNIAFHDLVPNHKKIYSALHSLTDVKA
jgi:hypothetical protein